MGVGNIFQIHAIFFFFPFDQRAIVEKGLNESSWVDFFGVHIIEGNFLVNFVDEKSKNEILKRCHPQVGCNPILNFLVVVIELFKNIIIGNSNVIATENFLSVFW